MHASPLLLPYYVDTVHGPAQLLIPKRSAEACFRKTDPSLACLCLTISLRYGSVQMFVLQGDAAFLSLTEIPYPLKETSRG